MTIPKKEYVLGFLFNRELTRVALIRKNRPEWQKGLLNGIGGQIEEKDGLTTNDDPDYNAMVREFKEETGVLHEKWLSFGLMHGASFRVHLFVGAGDLYKLKTVTDEEIVIVDLKEIYSGNNSLIQNVPALVSSAYLRILDTEGYTFDSVDIAYF